MKFESKNPYTGKILAQYAFSSLQELQQVIINAEMAFGNWKKLNYVQRGMHFMQLAKLMEDQKSQLAQTITIEMGKPIKESYAEIDKCILCCTYYAQNAEELLVSKHLQGGGLKAEVVFEPLGTIFGIFPWNFPFWQVLRFAVPTLMAGNTVIYKHAPNVPQCALHIERLFAEAGFPTSVLQTVFAAINDVESIIAHATIKAVTLTGSEKAGASVAALAGKYLKKSVMELGGSDAFVVLEDADIPSAVRAALKSRFQNSGQSCVSAKRFIVREEVAEDFTRQLLQGVQALKQGNPLQENIDMGTLARADLAERVTEQIQQTLALGAKLLYGGKRVADAVIAPTILTNVSLDSPAFTEEIFGPVAPVFIAKTDADALQLANNTVYGLGASVWTANAERARFFAQGINSGMVYINEMVRSTPQLPFGGINKSGYGRELSVLGITEFVNCKGIFSVL